MKSTCIICSKPERLEIDRRIVRGENYSLLAKENNVSYWTIWNHATNHVSRQLVQATRKSELMESMDIIGDVEHLIQRTKTILTDVEEKKHHGTALQAIRELRGHYELLSKIAFALHQARLAELEHAQMDREYEDHTERQRISKRLQKLTIDQLKTLQQISFEVFRESWENYGIEPLDEYKPMRRTKPPKRKPEPEPEPDHEPEPEPEILDTTEYFAKKQVKVFRSLK